MAPANRKSTARNTKPKTKFSNNVPPGMHYLPLLDPRSDEFTELFRSFLSSRDERMNILAFSEPDARLFIEIIDKAFRAARLDTQLCQLAFGVLRRLCGSTGHLPDSYLLSDKFGLSGLPRVSGGFADVRVGVFRGKDVAVKSLRVSEADDKVRIRKRFCKEVAMWKNLSHPNILDLIGVPDTLEDGKFSTVSEWMANGNIMEYVRGNAGNHLKLLVDAIEGLEYLHNANIIHGDLRGANILITNTDPVSACLADFGFMTIVHDPGLEMDSLDSRLGGGTNTFMAPELLIPSRFGLDKCKPTKETDVYAMGMVIYQVLTGTLPFGRLSGSELVFKVLRGEKPSKPANALKLGLSDDVWKLLEDCWQTDRTSRPSMTDVSVRVKAAASVCGILSSVGGVVKMYEDPDSEYTKLDQLFLGLPSDDEELGGHSTANGKVVSKLEGWYEGMYPQMTPSQRSTLTDTSLPDQLFSKLSEVSETEGHVTEPPRKSTDALPDILSSPALDYVPHLQSILDPISRPSTPDSEAITRPRTFRNNSSPYRNQIFSEPSSSGRKIIADAVSTQREHPRSDFVVLHDGEIYHMKPSAVGNLVASSFLLVSSAAGIVLAQARGEDPTRQRRRPFSMLSLYIPKSNRRGCLANTDDGAERKLRRSHFRIRQQLARLFSGNAHK